jgi:hypothetical protein
MKIKTKVLLIKVSVLLCLSFLLLGFKSVDKWYEPIVLKGQDVTYSDGEPIIISHQTKTLIMVSLGKLDGDLIIHIGFKNFSDKPINILPEGIVVGGINKSEIVKDLKVYTANDYISKIKTERNINYVSDSLASAYNAQNSGYSSSNTTYSGSVSTNGQYGNFSGSSQTSTYDQSKVNQQIQKDQEKTQKAFDGYTDYMRYLDSILLKRNTLDPNQSTIKYVVADYSMFYKEKIIVHIQIDSDEHNFLFKSK